MRVVLGIGNPGAEYEATRHNLGFAVIDALAQAHPDGQWRRQGPSSVFEYRPASLSTTADPPSAFSGPVLLVKPQTYVNNSGDAALAIMSYYKLTPLDLLIVVDDLTLALGHLRLRADGTAGGHNGLRDIESKLGKAYPRLRLGMGPMPPGANQVGFVLGRFAPQEQAEVTTMIARAVACVEGWLVHGVAIACTFNGPSTPPAPRPKPVKPPPPAAQQSPTPPGEASPSGS
jgi:PTH1 family peptidyl-tRNA hydrolase